MLQQSIDELVKKAGNRYVLTIAASQRARELIATHKDPNEFNTQKPLTVATNEILEGELLAKTEEGGECPVSVYVEKHRHHE